MSDGFSRVALLADTHGNLVALEAVLAEVAELGVRHIVVAGDIAWGVQPCETVARVMALGPNVIVIRGNADREVAHPETVAADPDLGASTAWCAAQMTDEQRRWLDELPLTATLRIKGMGDVLVCHGSPRSDTEGMRPDTDPDLIASWLAGTPEPIVVCGHTHVQFERTIGRHRIVNPGSVGLHYGVGGAQWALLGSGGVELRTTAYDSERAADLAAASGMPGADELAAFLRDPTRMS